MNIYHKSLADGRWAGMPFLEKMANIGSEVSRAVNWKNRNNPERCTKAFERALELIDLTLQSEKEYPRLKEITRVREALVDYFFGENEYGSSDELWEKYFYHLTFAAASQRLKD